MNKLFAPFLPPWAETGLQPAFYDLESGTVLQQTARMYDKVNQLIRLFNELSEETQTTVEEYIAKFIELKDFVDDYFDNLDVQEEINNKLDAMAEAGTLQEIISEYLNSTAVFGFDTVADMKSATNLIDGSYARTLGYYAKNDGGGATYKIREITNDDVVDEATIIEMGDGSNQLIAELIIEEPINVKTLGVYGDGTHDDYATIQLGITKFTHHTLYFPSGTYLITQPLSIGTTNAEQVDLKLESDSEIKTNTSIDSLLEIGKLEGAWNRYALGATVTIDGGYWNATNTTQAILIKANRKETTLKNLTVDKVSNTGILIDKGTNTSDSSDVNLSDVDINGVGSLSSSIGIIMKAYDNKLTNIRVNGCHIAINDQSGNFYQNVHVLGGWNNDTITQASYESSIGFKFNGGGISKLNECYVDTFGVGFEFDSVMKVYIDNSQSYHYLTNLTYKSALFKVTTSDTNLRVYINNFDWTPCSITGTGSNVGLDLSSTNTNYRTYLAVWGVYHFSGIQINEISRLTSYDDYLTCLSLYPDNSFTSQPAWTTSMTANSYYPIAVLKGGNIYDLTINMASDQIIRALITHSSSPTINVTNIYSGSHYQKYSLAICNLGTVDGVRTSYLCIKTTDNDSKLNPTIQGYKGWNNQVFSKFNIGSSPLINPTVNTEESFNPA